MEKCNKCEVNDTHTTLKVCTVCIQKALKKPDILINDLLAYANSYRDSCGKTNYIMLAFVSSGIPQGL